MNAWNNLFYAVFGDLVKIEEIDPEEMLKEYVARLKLRDREVIELRFGIVGTASTLKALGQRFGVSGERIRQIEARGLRKIRYWHWLANAKK